jgi:hypothetical protein
MKPIYVIFLAVFLITACKVNNKINKSTASLSAVNRCEQNIKYYCRTPIQEGLGGSLELTMEVYPLKKIIKMGGINRETNQSENDDVAIVETLECTLTENFSSGRAMFALTKEGKEEKGRMIINTIDGKLTIVIGDYNKPIEELKELLEVYKWEVIDN